MFILIAIAMEIREIMAERERLEFLSSKNGMTNFYNKRVLIEKIEEMIGIQKKENFSLIILDIDNFKEINDVLGHLEGDKIIIRIAKIIQSSLRAFDIPCRYGGDEMLVILPETDEKETYRIAENIRQKVYDEYKDSGFDVDISVSLGVAMHEKSESYDDLIEKVDKGLYEAKRASKNRTIVGYIW